MQENIKSLLKNQIHSRIECLADNEKVCFLQHAPFCKQSYKYIDTYNKYPMLLQSYLEDTRLTQTKAYKNLKANMEITNIFFELVLMVVMKLFFHFLQE